VVQGNLGPRGTGTGEHGNVRHRYHISGTQVLAYTVSGGETTGDLGNLRCFPCSHVHRCRCYVLPGVGVRCFTVSLIRRRSCTPC
jgi:hypothetical protein